MKHLFYLLLLAFFLALGCKQTDSKSKESKPTNFFSNKQKELVDTLNVAIQLRGTNLGNWLVPEGYMFKTQQVNSPRKIDELLKELIGPEKTNDFWRKHLDTYITQQDIAYLKKTGLNHLRLPFHYKLFTNEPYLGTTNDGFKYLDRVIKWCKEEGLYVLLDMHCAPGGQTGDNIDDSYGYPYLYESEACKTTFLNVWKDIAEHYKNESIVLGYDLLNEPIAHYFEDDIPSLEKELLTLYERAIDSIRTVDSNHLIFVNGSRWSTSFELFQTPFNDEKIVYEFHKYWMPPTQEEIQGYIDFSNQHNVPIYIGETGENTDEWVLAFRELLDNNNINWCFWPYKKMDNPKGIMNFELPKEYQSIINYAVSDRSSYKMIRQNAVNRDSVLIALNKYIEGCKYKNAYPNEGYCKGLNIDYIKE